MPRAPALLFVALAACTPRPYLAPAPAAEEVPSRGAGAVAEAQGVRVEARVDAWTGQPRRLDAVTPVLVTIENESDLLLRVRYNELSLTDEDGRRYAALPPFDIDETEVIPVTVITPRRFHPAHHHARYFPHLRPFPDPFVFDRGYYARHRPAFVRIDLPTADMVQLALPEGVLEPGGRVSGFVYFENPDREAEHIDFRLELTEARTGEGFGEVTIPFEVHWTWS